jgi:hypothetical protein
MSKGRSAEWRDVEMDDIESPVEVFAEAALIDLLFEIAVGGGDDAQVDFAFAVLADATNGSFLQNAQQFGLKGERHLADLIEEDRSTIGRLEEAGAGLARAGEGLAGMAEEFGLHQFGGDCRAVDGDKRSLVAATYWWIERATSSLPVPDSPVIRTVLALRAARLTSLKRSCIWREAPMTSSGETWNLAAKPGLFALRSRLLECLRDRLQQIFGIERFCQVLKGAGLDHLDRLFDRAKGGDDDDRNLRPARTDQASSSLPLSPGIRISVSSRSICSFGRLDLFERLLAVDADDGVIAGVLRVHPGADHADPGSSSAIRILSII